MMLRFTAVLLLVIGQAHARVEPGNWEFSVESPLQGNSGGPVTKQRCISPEEAGDPQKVLAEARGKNGEATLTSIAGTHSSVTWCTCCRRSSSGVRQPSFYSAIGS